MKLIFFPTAAQTVKERINDPVRSEAVNQCDPILFVQDVIHKTIENVLSSIDFESVAVAETKTPT